MLFKIKCLCVSMHSSTRLQQNLSVTVNKVDYWTSKTHCMSAESGGMYSPPAAFIDAVDPVAVQTHMPLDHTLNQSRAASPANRKGASSIEKISFTKSIRFDRPG